MELDPPIRLAPRVRLRGTATHPRERRPMLPTYQEVHRRLKDVRGSAKHRPCVSCGWRAPREAKNGCWWSYQFTGTLLRSPSGAPYSEDLSDYAPQCASCHNRLEWAMDYERQRSITLPNVGKATDAFQGKLNTDPEFSARFRKSARENALKAGEALQEKLRSDPVFRDEYRNTLSENGKRVSAALTEKLQSDPKFAAEHRARGRALSVSLKVKSENDPEFARKMLAVQQANGRKNGTKVSRMRRRCSGCGRVSTPAGLGKHLKDSGHVGYEEVV